MATIEVTYERLLDQLRGLGDVIIGTIVWVVALSFAAWAIVAEADGPMTVVWAAVFALILAAGILMFRYGDALKGRGDDLIVSGLWANLLVFGAWAILTRTDAFAVGVVTGSVLALGAIGLTLIYGILKFAHFAHGDSMMLAAYIAFFALTGIVVGERTDTQALPWSLSDLPGATDRLPWPDQLGGGDFSFGYSLIIAMVLSAVAMAMVFLLLDRFVYRPLRRRGSGIVIFAIASLGIAIAMRSLMLMFWASSRRLYVPGIRPTTELPFDVRIVTDQIFIFFTAIVIAALVYVLLFRTKLGKAMRAVSDNPDLAEVSGINPEQIIRWTWLIGGALVAVAGVMLALQAQLKPELGFILLLPLFAATILGGIGSPQGAFAGGMIVGISQEVAVTFGFIGPGYKFSIAFIMLILILLLRPRGLLGAKT
jgi:branched-chain amino acid transport system permease protein/neutral amino acid transport system permease protein